MGLPANEHSTMRSHPLSPNKVLYRDYRIDQAVADLDSGEISGMVCMVCYVTSRLWRSSLPAWLGIF